MLSITLSRGQAPCHTLLHHARSRSGAADLLAGGGGGGGGGGARAPGSAARCGAGCLPLEAVEALDAAACVALDDGGGDALGPVGRDSAAPKAAGSLTKKAPAEDWSRCLGPSLGLDPWLLGPDGANIELPGPLARGFDDVDADALGNWLRDAGDVAGAKQEASAAHSAAAAPVGQARRAAAVAALPRLRPPECATAKAASRRLGRDASP